MGTDILLLFITQAVGIFEPGGILIFLRTSFHFEKCILYLALIFSEICWKNCQEKKSQFQNNMQNISIISGIGI